MAKEDFSQRRYALIQSLIKQGILKSSNVINAMKKIPREKFLPKELWWSAYDDMPLPIGEGQTISAPHMVAIMAEAAELVEGLKFLEIGTGCGYNAAVLSEIISPERSKNPGHLYTIEIIPQLYENAKRNLDALGYLRHVTNILGDGSIGYLEEAPYNRIMVTASAPRILEGLVNQLTFPGILLIPIGDTYYGQELVKFLLDEKGKKTLITIGNVVFVPLVGKEGWKK